CNPRKYHAAFDGLGVRAEAAGSSIGASTPMLQRLSSAAKSTKQMSSVWTRSGHEKAFCLPSSPSSVGRPFFVRSSLMYARRSESHEKYTTDPSRITIGTLSGFVMIALKLGSPNAKIRKSVPSTAKALMTTFRVEYLRKRRTTKIPTTKRKKYIFGSVRKFVASLMN